MIALDTNILVHAHREESEWYSSASACVTGLAEGRAAWAIPWPCIPEFIAIVTHPRIFRPPTTIAAAVDQVSAWFESPTLVVISETDGYWAELEQLLKTGRVTGPIVHDARVAALCIKHGVRELWTADRDFGRFPKLRTVNPLVDLRMP